VGVFGVPDGQDREFFLEAGLDLGETLKIGSPETVKRYAMRQDLMAMDDADRRQAEEAAAVPGYWLAELTVRETGRNSPISSLPGTHSLVS
jgi:hypothetical protein